MTAYRIKSGRIERSLAVFCLSEMKNSEELPLYGVFIGKAD